MVSFNLNMATQHTYEFELYDSGCEEGWLIAEPFEFAGGTQGRDIGEVSEMAADWLRCEIEARSVLGEPLPPAAFGHEPKNGGRIVIVSVQAGLDTVPRVSASEAARLLGVSPGRVSQMLSSGQLMGWREGGRTWVTQASVEARLAEAPRPGRPSSTGKVVRYAPKVRPKARFSVIGDCDNEGENERLKA